MPDMSRYYTEPRTDPNDVLKIVVPLDWFLTHKYLSPGQALYLYLIDEVKLSFTDAASLVGKDETTIRLTYKKAHEKRAIKQEQAAKKKAQRKARKEAAAK